MKPITFITGNLDKVTYLEKYLGYPIEHIKIDLDELQSLDVKKIVEHKVRQAYDKVHKPVLVEDGSLVFEAFNGLPGPFIKFFVENISMETMCRMVDGHTRKATAHTTFGYFDGTEVTFLQGKLKGEIAEHPAGEKGWAWDKILIPEGYTVTRAQMSEEEYQNTSMHLRPFAELKTFLESL